MTVEIGRPAPDFTLADQHGQQVTLSSVRGARNAVVMFYPFAFSGICAGELHAIRDDLASFHNDDVELLAVSCDHMFSLRAFADRDDLDYPLLSDFWPHGEVSRAYEVFDERAGAAIRGTFVVDREGLLRWQVVNPIGTARDLDDLRRALHDLQVQDPSAQSAATSSAGKVNDW